MKIWPVKKKRKWIPKVGDRIFLSWDNDRLCDATILHIRSVSVRTTYWVLCDCDADAWNLGDLDWHMCMLPYSAVYRFNSDSGYKMIPMTDDDQMKLPTPDKVLDYLQRKENVITTIPIQIEREIKDLLTEMSCDDILGILRGIKIK